MLYAFVVLCGAAVGRRRPFLFLVGLITSILKIDTYSSSFSLPFLSINNCRKIDVQLQIVNITKFK